MKTIDPPRIPCTSSSSSVTSTHVLDGMYLWQKTICSAGVRFCSKDQFSTPLTPFFRSHPFSITLVRNDDNNLDQHFGKCVLSLAFAGLADSGASPMANPGGFSESRVSHYA